MKIKYNTLSVAYGIHDDSRSYWLYVHEMNAFQYLYWKLRYSFTWTVCSVIHRFDTLHDKWVDLMELPATLALEIDSVICRFEITEDQYLEMHGTQLQFMGD